MGPVHAGLIARWSGAAVGWRGVLIEGPSGAGKSDLALRAAAAGWRLVADDRVLLWASGGRLFGRAPDALQGLMEVRGVGVAPSPGALRVAAVDLIVRHDTAPERFPDPSCTFRAGVRTPLLGLDLCAASAPLKLSWALAWAVESDLGSQLGAGPA